MERGEAAILVRKARKRYGNDGKYILDDLNMTVTKGTIYGLLGASGCGKTTLLSTIVGSKEVQSGTVTVLGQPPGAASVKSIGYMPQDIALVGEFTVKGALEHFGWIFGMTDKQINERFKFLSKLLDLPPADRLVKTLSGGQQRRVSLAVVLVHDPQLLILDEPTVGLDPVIRQNIWDYLVQITQENKTIIITTHYIEEARQANYIGLMRNGKILAEGKPQYLIETYGCSSIENVFVHLSKMQADGIYDNVEEMENNNRDNNQMIIAPETVTVVKKSLLGRLKFTNKGHAKALLSKNFYKFKRHPGTLAFAFGFPFIQILVFLLAIGTMPDDTKIGVVNEEMGNYTNCEEYKLYNPVGGFLMNDNITCIYQGLSCKFIDNLGAKLKNKVYYPSMKKAFEAIKEGQIHQMIYFSHNYSKAVTNVQDPFQDISDEDIVLREIAVYRDTIDSTLSHMINKELLDAYNKYIKDLAKDCNTNPDLQKIPIKFNKPIYGVESLTFRDYMAPGTIIAITAFLGIGISSLAIITERTEGVWDRTIVSGVSKTEILIFHTLVLCVVSLIQISELFIVAFYVFDLECKGSKLFAFLLVYLQSIIGVCFGILISIVARTVTEANLSSMGLFYPFIILSGSVWPLEGMPTLLRYMSYFVPTTLPVEAMSSIIHRGWKVTNFHVGKGFLSSFGFILCFTLASMLILKYEKK